MILRYLAARLRHRDPAAVAYLRQGFLIEDRARRLHRFWQPHLERSKAAQKRWLDASPAGIDLAVLGPGRLLDFAGDAATKRFKRLLMIDADPSCTRHWQRVSTAIEPRIADLTGSIRRWQRELDGLQGTWKETLDRIRNIVSPADRPLPFAADAVLSLNVMSQLPIGWQDRVEDHLKRRFGARHTTAHQAEWLAAVEPAARWIVEQHLAALAASSARSILLITDVEYIDYHEARTEVSPALYGVDPVAALRGYTLSWQDKWQWDISPVGSESPTCGTAHRVSAYAFDCAR